MDHTHKQQVVETHITEAERQLMLTVAENKGTFNNKQIAELMGISATKVKTVYDCYRFYLAGHQEGTLAQKRSLEDKAILTKKQYADLMANQKLTRKKFLGIF